MSTTHIVRCSKTCTNSFQDATYGDGKRAHNEMANGSLRCTVCLNVNDNGAANRRAKK